MDAALRRALRRLPEPGDGEERLARLLRVGAVRVRDLRVLGVLGLPGGAPQKGWREQVLREAFRSDAALGGVGETDLKPIVLQAAVRLVRRALRSWLRDPEGYRVLSGHLVAFEELSGRPLLPSRQERARLAAGEIANLVEARQAVGRQRAGALALVSLFEAFRWPGRWSIGSSVRTVEPHVSSQRVLRVFREEVLAYVLERSAA